MPTTVTSTTTLAPAQMSDTQKLSVQQDKETEPVSVSQQPNDHDSFFWTYTEEPHRSRRMAIIKAHPEVHLSTELSVPL